MPAVLPRSDFPSHLELVDLRHLMRDPQVKSKVLHGKTVMRAPSQVDGVMLHQTAVEFGGRYPESKLRAFHDYCAERDLGYEVW